MFMGIFVVLFLACAVMSVGTQWCVCVCETEIRQRGSQLVRTRGAEGRNAASL